MAAAYREFPYLVDVNEDGLVNGFLASEVLKWVQQVLELNGSEYRLFYSAIRFKDPVKAAMFKLRWG